MPQTALPNLGINYNYDVGADGWGAGLDFDLVALDALTMPRVQDKDLSAPPASPAQGLAWIVGASPTGAWAGKAGQIAVASSAAAGGWFFFVPKSGWTTYVVGGSGAGLEHEYTGSAWQAKSSTFGNTLIKSVDAAAARTALGAAPAFGNQSANQVYAGPTTGGAAAPLFRALVAADIPSIPISKISDAGSMASQDSNAVSISGGAINGTAIGATTPSTVNATTVTGTGNASFAGNTTIGGTPNPTVSLRVPKDVTGGAVAYNILADGIVQSGVTTSAYGVQTRLNTQATAFTLPSFFHHSANGGTVGAGSTVTNQYGFFADAALTGANNNYGFYGNLAAASGRWNCYMAGTALNYFNGNSLFGKTTDDTFAKIQSSNGITLGNTANANPTVLDFYEEGTFTPAVIGLTTAGVGTYTVQSGKYTRKGNRVTGNISLNWTAHTGTGNMQITGLPFASSSANLSACSVYYDTFTVAAGKQLVARITGSVSVVGLFAADPAGGAIAFIPMDTAAQLIITFDYEVS